MPKVGIVAFAFALRGTTPDEMRRLEPNPCNIRLARETARIARKYPDHEIVSQWEITPMIRHYDTLVSHSVELRDDGSYLNSEGVWHEATDLFKEEGIRDVVLMAQPFLQLGRVVSMARKDGFHVIKERIGEIGFDDSPLNSQPWTRSAAALTLYAVKQAIGKSGGHNGRQTA